MNDRMMEKQNTADTDTLLIPTTRVVHERNVAVAEGCQMIVLTQTPNLPCFFRLVWDNFNVVPCPRRHFFNTTCNILTSVLSRLTAWMVNLWHSWRKGDTTPFWCCFLIPSLHRTGANQFPWWTTLKDLKHCTSARVYQYLALRGRKQVINKSYLHIMESVSRWHDESLHAFFVSQSFHGSGKTHIFSTVWVDLGECLFRSKAKSSSRCWFGEGFPTVYFKTFPPRSCSTPLPIAEKDWWLPPDRVIWILNLNDSLEGPTNSKQLLCFGETFILDA